MKKYEKEIEKRLLDNEKEVVKKLEKTYEQALDDIEKKLSKLDKQIQKLVDENPDNETLIRSKIYQRDYQKMLKGQVKGALEILKSEHVKSIDDYLKLMYEDGFLTQIFRNHNEGIPVVVPINHKLMVKATTYDTEEIPLSERLYTNIEKTKEMVIAEISRGIATGMNYNDMARNIKNALGVSFRKARQIAQNEGHRVVTDATIDGIRAANEKGADQVKQWSCVYDGKTRPVHAELDRQYVEVEDYFTYSGGKVFAPKKFGKAALDINCRCRIYGRPRWYVEGEETVLKRDNVTGELIEVKNYAEWKEKYLEKQNEFIKTHPNKRIFVETDEEQHERYRKILGNEFVPKDLDTFKQIKADKEKWNDLKAKYRTVNRYKVDYGEVTASDILELDNQARITKQKFTRNKFVADGNIGVLKEEDSYKFAFSKIDNETDEAYKKFTGDKSSLLLIENDRHYKTLKKGDLVDGIENTHDRASDSEAKMFEYLRKKHKPNDKFTITILSERNMCESCRGVYEQFKKDFPNAIINVVSGRKSKKGNSPWKHRKISKE